MGKKVVHVLFERLQVERQDTAQRNLNVRQQVRQTAGTGGGEQPLQTIFSDQEQVHHHAGQRNQRHPFLDVLGREEVRQRAVWGGYFDAQSHCDGGGRLRRQEEFERFLSCVDGDGCALLLRFALRSF